MTISQLRIVHRTPLAMQCSSCGASAIASCDCGAPYIPASDRAAKAIADNPSKSSRAIAADLGLSHTTVNEVRKSTGKQFPVDTRVGRDGKVRQMPQRKIKTEEIMPTEEEAEESYQETIYDQACLFLEEMTGATRRRFFAHIKRKYHVG
jgi:hypothetical protein